MPKSKSMCCGCREDYYNHNQPDGCWLYKTAKIVQRVFVGTWEPPPYTWNPRKTLSCWNSVGLHAIGRDDCRVVMPKKEKAPYAD